MVELARLTTFTMKYYEYGTSQTILDTFKRYTPMEILCILFDPNLSDISFSPPLRFTCDHHPAVDLIPKLPTTTHVENLFCWGERPWSFLHELSKTGMGLQPKTLVS